MTIQRFLVRRGPRNELRLLCRHGEVQGEAFVWHQPEQSWAAEGLTYGTAYEAVQPCLRALDERTYRNSLGKAVDALLKGAPPKWGDLPFALVVLFGTALDTEVLFLGADYKADWSILHTPNLPSVYAKTPREVIDQMREASEAFRNLACNGYYLVL